MKRLTILVCLGLWLSSACLAQERPELLLQKGHSGSADILNITSLPDSGQYVTVGSDGAVRLWDGESRLVLRTIYDKATYPDPEKLGTLRSTAFSPSRDWVVTVDSDGIFRRYSLPQGELLDQFQDKSAYNSPALQTDGKSLFYYRRDTLVRTDLQGKIQAELSVERKADKSAKLVLSGDTTMLAIPTKGGVSIVDSQSLTEKAFKSLNSTPWAFSFGPDGSELAIRTNSAFALLSTSDLSVISVVGNTVNDGRQIPIWVGSQIYLYPQSGSTRNQLLAFDRVSKSLKSLGERPAAISIESRANQFLVGSFGGSSWVIDADKEEKLELASDIGGFPAFTIDPVTGDLITGSRSGEVVRWSSSTGREIQRYEGLKAYMASISVSPDGSKVLAGDVSYGDVICWDAKSGKELSRVKLGGGRFLSGIRFARFVDSDRYVVSTQGSKEAAFTLRKASDASVLNSWPISAPYSYALNSSGTRLIAGYYGGLLEADLVNKRDVLRTSLPRYVQANAVCYGADGKTVYAGASDGNIYSWDSSEPKNKAEVLHRTGRREVLELDFQSGKLEAILETGKILALSPSGKEFAPRQLSVDRVWGVTRVDKGILASGGINNSILFFDSSSGEQLGRLAGVRDNSGWVYMDRSGAFDGNDVGLETVSFELDGRLYSVNQFMEKFLRPGILAKVLPKASESNARTGPELTASNVKHPPKVDILSPVSGTVIDTETVEVKVNVAAQGGGVSDVSLYHNGHKLPDRQKKKIDESTVVFTVRPLKGKNEFRATAFDSTRSVESRQDRVRVVAPNVKARPPKLHLLSVGVDRYTSGLSLKFAENDATSVSKLFSSGLYAQGERKLLSNEQATLAGIKSALASISAVAEPQDAFVFYLAGHGTVIGEDYYFLPHDVKIDTDQSVSQTAFSSDDLGKALQSVPATKQLLVLDSCRSGAAAGVVGRYFASRAGLEEIRSQQLLARASGTFLIAATKGEDYAYEIPQLGHGVLTYALLESLGVTKSSEATEGGITANDLLRAVSTKVPKLSEQYQGVRQQVIQYSSGQDFPLSE